MEVLRRSLLCYLNITQSSAGKVLVDGKPADKAGTSVSESQDINLIAEVPKYVCRCELRLFLVGTVHLRSHGQPLSKITFSRGLQLHSIGGLIWSPFVVLEQGTSLRQHFSILELMFKGK